MPAFDVALVKLGTFIGLFDDNGSVRWQWFTDPISQGFDAMPAQRDEFGALLRALLDRSQPTGPFTPGDDWEPVIEEGGVALGLTWSTADPPGGAPLRLGIGARADFPFDGGQQQISFAALARMIEIVGSTESVSPELGRVELAGTFPVPGFLAAGSIVGSLSPTPSEITVGLAATDPQGETRQLDYSQPVVADVLGWDAGRLAVFVLHAWVRQQAAGGSEFFTRVNDHLFPMIGDPPGPIQPFPLVQPMKAVPDFAPWRDSVLSTADGASGALTFLWHLRALLTGVESTDFLSGSMFFPLAAAPPSPNPPTPADATGTYTHPMGTTGAWVGLLTEPAGTFTLVVDLEIAGQSCRIPLAGWDGTTFQRPNLVDGSWDDVLAAIQSGGLDIVDDEMTAVGNRLTLLGTTVSGSGLVGFDGTYEIALVLQANQPVRIVLHTPVLDIDFPPPGSSTPEQLVGSLVTWAMQAAAPDGDFGDLVRGTADLARACIASGVPEPLELLTLVLGIAGQGQDLTVDLGSGAQLGLGVTSSGNVEAGVGFGPIVPGDPDDDPQITVGKLSGSVVVDPAQSPFLNGFTIGLDDLRIGSPGEGGIVATLIPDMRELSGFRLALTYEAGANPPVVVTGGGKIPIQRTLGPLEIAALLIDIREESMAIALDLGFELGPILVAAYELGLRFGFDDGTVEPFLHGLGLSMDTDMIKLGGFFAAVEHDELTDYVGGALVSVAGYFELSAIGGYTQLPNDKASLFLFASLVAPLGGPPWFFMTGVAGGFGFNRTLPAPGLMLDHPFLKVMSGQLELGADATDALTELSRHFLAQEGQHWIAAGIQFISFGFITGRVVIAIGFGQHFSISILGMASFSLEPLAYIEIGLEATADEEHFSLRAGISPNSYVLHPDIFSLQGDIALCAWYAPPHKGDFLFSIGGYHPLFSKPDHYPELTRVGCKATLYDFVHLTIEVFFACTPQALMAGAKASLWAEFMGIAAGLDVYVDVLMMWDPFFLIARLGICIWFEFFGRHEIGVELEIWTPEFGGRATIDLALVSFTVSFGTELARPGPPPIADFLSAQLALPAKRQGCRRAGQDLQRARRARPVQDRVPVRPQRQGGRSADLRRAAGGHRLVRTGAHGSGVELPVALTDPDGPGSGTRARHQCHR